MPRGSLNGPPRLSSSRRRIPSGVPPTLGQHTDESTKQADRRVLASSSRHDFESRASTDAPGVSGSACCAGVPLQGQAHGRCGTPRRSLKLS